MKRWTNSVDYVDRAQIIHQYGRRHDRIRSRCLPGFRVDWPWREYVNSPVWKLFQRSAGSSPALVAMIFRCRRPRRPPGSAFDGTTYWKRGKVGVPSIWRTTPRGQRTAPHRPRQSSSALCRDLLRKLEHLPASHWLQDPTTAPKPSAHSQARGPRQTGPRSSEYLAGEDSFEAADLRIAVANRGRKFHLGDAYTPSQKSQQVRKSGEFLQCAFWD